MKLLTAWFLTLNIVLSPLTSWAEAAPNVPRAQKTMGRLLSSPGLRLLSTASVGDLRERVEEAAKSKARDAAVGTGQTLLVMMTLAGVELVAQQARKNGGAPTPAQLAAISKTVANSTVNSPLIWTSILASSGFSLTLKPAQALMAMLKIPKLRGAFAPLLARSITSTVAFVGWDFGAQLWTEASLLLKTKEDYQLANDTFGMSKGVLSVALATKAHSNSQLDAARARVAREMMTNMILVLTVSDLRHQLVSNFIRNDLLTGEFQTTLGSFIAAGAIGTAIFPGAGTLVGLIFGAVGAVVAQFIPQSAKDKITNGYQYLRTRSLETSLQWNLGQLKRDLRKPDIQHFASTLNSRNDLRSRWITIHWEQMHMEARAGRVDLRRTYQRHFVAMKQFYERQLEMIALVVSSSPQMMKRDDVRKLVGRENVRCSQMIQFFDALGAAAQVDPKNDEITKSIEAAASRGFNETNTVLAWLQSA